jgi:hypothetical protein
MVTYLGGSILITIFALGGSIVSYNLQMIKYIHKSHNVTVLLYHMAFPAKYR